MLNKLLSSLRSRGWRCRDERPRPSRDSATQAGPPRQAVGHMQLAAVIFKIELVGSVSAEPRRAGLALDIRRGAGTARFRALLAPFEWHVSCCPHATGANS